MLVNIVAGILGLVVQIIGFVLIMLVSSRGRSWSRAAVDGVIVAVPGFALIVALFALFSVRWQVVDLALAVGIAMAFLSRRLRDLVASGLPTLLRGIRGALAAVVVICSVIAFQLVVAMLKSEMSIDGQLYHGPTLAEIVSNGSLWGWHAPNQYMYYTDASMAGGVNLATFAGGANFDDALQVPDMLLLLLVINWVLSRRFASPFLRVSVAVLVVAAPVIWLQARILYVDLAYGAVVASAIFFVVTVSRFTRFDFVICGILLGAVFATKPTGILTGVLLLCAVVVAVVVRRRRTVPVRRTLADVLIGIGIPLVLSTSFYLRNLIAFGSPVYPVAVSLGPIKLPGILDLSVFTSGDRGNGLADPSRWGSYLQSMATGMLHGVTKLDYDPRAGGYGYVILLLLGVATALIVLQLLIRRTARSIDRSHPSTWRMQLGLLALAAAVILIQPSSFDTRYVIGPTVALLVAVLVTSVGPLPRSIQLVAAILALGLAAGQVWWTERHMYPGLGVINYLRQAPADVQPLTPGNPWGSNPDVAWMAEQPKKCLTIALQTAGGVTPTGMSEQSLLGTFPYGLYGSQLCNEVLPVTLSLHGAPNARVILQVRTAEFLVLYARDVARWVAAVPELAKCLRQVAVVPSSDGYPVADRIYQDTCVK